MRAVARWVCNGVTAICLVGLTFNGLPVAAVAFSDASLDALVAELTATKAEFQKLEQEIPKIIQDSLTIKRRHEAEVVALDTQINNLEKSEGAAIDAQRPSVVAACPATAPPEQIASVQARCQAAQAPFNARVDAFNSQLNNLKAKLKVVDEAEKKRISEVQAVKARSDMLAGKLRSLTAKMFEEKLKRCRLASENSPAETAVQQQAICFDGAKQEIEIILGAPPKPPSSITPARTPQQAIDDYVNSGKAPGTQGRKSAPPPPPPPLPKK